jgi:hypothetical protein
MMHACAAQGIPARHRVWAWPRICGARAAQQGHMAHYFEAMVQRGESTSECLHQIELVNAHVVLPDQACCLPPARPPSCVAAGQQQGPASTGQSGQATKIK